MACIRRILTLSNRWSVPTSDPEILSPFLRNSLREFTSFQLKRKALRVSLTLQWRLETGRLLLMRIPAGAGLWFITFIWKWEEVRAQRGSHSFQGGISPATASTWKYSHSYLINGCLLWALWFCSLRFTIQTATLKYNYSIILPSRLEVSLCKDESWLLVLLKKSPAFGG